MDAMKNSYFDNLSMADSNDKSMPGARLRDDENDRDGSCDPERSKTSSFVVGGGGSFDPRGKQAKVPQPQNSLRPWTYSGTIPDKYCFSPPVDRQTIKSTASHGDDKGEFHFRERRGNALFGTQGLFSGQGRVATKSGGLFGGLKQDATQVELLGHFPVFGDGVSKTTLPATSSPVTSQTEKVLSLEESLKKTEKGLAVAQEQIKTVNDELTTTLNQARKAAARVEELERQIASLEKEKLDLNMAKATMEKTCEDLTVKSQLLESFKEGYSQLQHELDRVQAKYNELQGTCNDAVVERDDLQERINTMTLAEKSSTDREPDSPTSRLEPVLPHSARPTSTSDLDRLDGLVYYWEGQLRVKKALVEETTANVVYFDSEISKTQHHVRQARKPAQSATSSNQRFDVGLKTLVDGGDASAEEDATKQDTGPVKPSRIPDSVARTNGMNWASTVGGNTTFQSPPQQANNNAGSAVEEEWPAPAHGEANVNTMKLRRRG